MPVSPSLVSRSNRRSRTVLFSLALTLLVALASSAGAAVHIVDCVAGPFVEIQTAVDVSLAGDTVLIEPCPMGAYLPFVVDGKSDLHIVGNGGRQVLPIGLPTIDFSPPVRVEDDPDVLPFNCVEIVDSNEVTLSGITFGNCGFHAIQVSAEGVRITGNRFEPSFETVRDGSANGAEVVGNLFVGGAFAIFVDGSGSLIANNVIVGNQGSGISILSSQSTGHVVMNNVIRGSQSEAIFSSASQSRIERNLCDNNGGLAAIVLSNLADTTTVVGNITGDSISDSGTGNIIVGNQ